jgi:hypothetical protein
VLEEVRLEDAIVKVSAAICALGITLAAHASAGAQVLDSTNPLYAAPNNDEVFIQLVDNLGEPRGFCLDFPGFPMSGIVGDYRESTWPLGTHTCKTGIENANVATIDQVFSKSAIGPSEKHLRFTRLKECVEILTFRGVSAPGHVEETSIRQDAQMVAKTCSSAPEQQFVMDDKGRIKPIADQTKCLTIGREAFEAGDRTPGKPWYRRDVNFSACSAANADRQIWRLTSLR